ncbi:Inversin [Gryllus bimaculatus]|nr:Inversin [Gryllus bimaculatus]
MRRDVTQARSWSVTASHYAYWIRVVEFLLVECRMFVDAPSKVERLTALQCAVRAGNVDCVRTLLAFGADPRRCDARGRTAEDFFSGLNNEEIEALLTEGQTTMWQPENVEAAPVHFLDSGGEISS